MLPEWGRFVTAVKLNRGLRDSNYDQLYAYLKQHEIHANENKVMLDRFSQHTVDPLALMSNVLHQQHYSQSSSTPIYVPPHLAEKAHLDSSLSSTDNLFENLTNILALLTQSYKTFLPQTNNQLRTSSNTRNQATVQAGRVVVQNVQGRQNRYQGINPRGGGATGYGGVQNRVGNANPGQAQQVKCYNCNCIWHIARNCTQPKCPQNYDYYKDKMLLMQAQENGGGIGRIADLALSVDNVFQADDCDVFDSDVDEAPTAQTMFMANLSSADPVNDEAGPSYDSNILSGYVKDNAVPIVHSNVSSVPNDAYMMIYNDMYESHVQSVYKTSRNTVVENLLTAELATYKEQVELYERRARKKMNDKMKDPECVTHKVKIASHDYSKENFLATFTPQKQLTPEQIFWSQDLIKIKSEALKEQTMVSRPIKALTVITPTGLTEGEMGSEQTKECYLKEVIPFFKTLKENSEGIQKALTKEIKEIKDVFEELKAEVAQNVVDRKLDEVERKNLLIANDNLIPDCLTKEVFSVATNSKLNVARFTEIHVANTIVETRCLELEAELFNLRDKSHNNNHDELVNLFSNLEVNHLNLQLKYQNLKDSLGNNPPTPNKDTPDFDSVFLIGKMQASLQGKDNVIRQLKKQISHLQETRSDTDRTLKVTAVNSHITRLTKKVTVLQAQNDSFTTENDNIKKHYKELYDSIKITHAKHIEQVTALTTKTVNLKAQILDTINSVSKEHVKPKVLAPGKYTIDVETIVPRLRNNRKAHLDYLRHLKKSVETIRDIVEEANVVRPLDSLIVFACRYTKHSQELLEYAIGTCPQDSHQRDKKHAHAFLIRKKQVTFAEQCDKSNSNTHKHVAKLNTQKTNVPMPPSTRVNHCTDTSGSKPRSNTKKNRISPAKGVNKMQVEEQPSTYKSHLRTSNHVDSSSRHKHTVVQIVLWYLDSGWLKHMTGDRSRLMNFVKKFIKTVRFENDHFGAIIGYEDYVIGDSVISRVYYVEGLEHNLFSVRQFCDADLEVAFRKHSCYV
nr:integrase, catalytic region, zinc finger, CCHC-type, peptidase aspartic, catalytic [Tanacetum cinerariifolium]